MLLDYDTRIRQKFTRKLDRDPKIVSLIVKTKVHSGHLADPYQSFLSVCFRGLDTIFSSEKYGNGMNIILEHSTPPPIGQSE